MKTEFFSWLFIKRMSSPSALSFTCGDIHVSWQSWILLSNSDFFAELSEPGWKICNTSGRKKINIKKTIKQRQKKEKKREVVIGDTDIYVTSSRCDHGAQIIYNLNAKENKHKVWSLFKTAKNLFWKKIISICDQGLNQNIWEELEITA